MFGDLEFERYLQWSSDFEFERYLQCKNDFEFEKFLQCSSTVQCNYEFEWYLQWSSDFEFEWFFQCSTSNYLDVERYLQWSSNFEFEGHLQCSSDFEFEWYLQCSGLGRPIVTQKNRDLTFIEVTVDVLNHFMVTKLLTEVSQGHAHSLILTAHLWQSSWNKQNLGVTKGKLKANSHIDTQSGIWQSTTINA